MESSTQRELGTVYTFYSYKGGVGRTMALANVATLLANWGLSVLIVDWDLEAPGVERYFLSLNPSISGERHSKPGVVDLIVDVVGGKTSINWQDCLIDAYPSSPVWSVSIMTAGRDDDHYTDKVQSINFDILFQKEGLGTYLEQLRNEWRSNFDFILVDSRTGISDIGGICTIHLPDILVLLFTANHPSVTGCVEVLRRARAQQMQLPFDRRRLLGLPIPARDESRTELKKANEWRTVFSDVFAEIYKDWLPIDKTAADALEVLRLPNVPYWSFGESLPVVEETLNDPSTLSFAYQTVARLISTRLDWNAALSGEFLSRPSFRPARDWDYEWLQNQRARATAGLNRTQWKGSVEVRFFSPSSDIVKPQDELLTIARLAAVHTFGWPIGLVLDREGFRPRPMADGIVTEVTSEHSYDYWCLTKALQFYTLMSLFEDFRDPSGVLFMDTQIVRTTEAIMYAANVYRGSGAQGNTAIRLGLRHQGLRGRVLTVASPYRGGALPVKTDEDVVETEISFVLEKTEEKLVDLVEQLCTPLFLIFGFTRIERAVYQDIVTNFQNGIVR